MILFLLLFLMSLNCCRHDKGFMVKKVTISFLLQILLCNSMPHKELVVYVSEYMIKNSEVLKPIVLSLQALCWPLIGKLDEVNISLYYLYCELLYSLVGH